ncbi:MAG TPA: tetratricopeptide repeat protein [Terriglobales bacterium]|nr:tetratricopeptide repeat protein [Terriglobales bacterium]
MVHRTLVVLATLLALSLSAVAQMHPGSQGNNFNTGSISGIVRSGDDHPAPNVRIEIRSMNNGQVVSSAYTSPNGTFEVMSLPAGPYEVHAIAGLNDIMERVDLRSGDSFITMHMPRTGGNEADGSATVSVSQFRVPAKARDIYHKAERALDKQKYDEAEKQVNKALELFPAYADALTLRALLRLDAGRTPEALDDLQKAIHADASYALAYVVMGAAQNQTSKFDDAVRTLQRGISLNPASWQAYFEMGKAFVGKGDFPTAIRNLDQAQQMAPATYAPLHLVKAHALLGMKNYTDAMAELEKYLEKDPNGQSSVQARQTLEKVRAFVATKK